MREMLEKVPEGDWLCEECKDAEVNENKKPGKSEAVYLITRMAFWVRHFTHLLCFLCTEFACSDVEYINVQHIHIYGCMLTFVELNFVVQILKTRKLLKLVQPHKFLAKDFLITWK